MTIEDCTDEIIELVYHSAVVHDDPYVQERAVRAGVWDLLEEFEASVVSDRVKGLEHELESLEEAVSKEPL